MRPRAGFALTLGSVAKSLLVAAVILQHGSAADADSAEASPNQKAALNVPARNSDVPADIRLQRKRFPDLGDVVRVFGYRPFGHSAPVTSIVFADGDRTLVTGTRSGVRLWDVEAKELRGGITAASLNATQLAISRDGQTLIVAGDQGDVRAIDRRSGKETSLITPAQFGPTRYLTKIALSPDGKLLAIGFRRWSWSDARRRTTHPHTVTEGGFELWDVRSAKQLVSKNDVEGAAIALSWSAGDEVLAVGRVDGRIRFYESDGSSHGRDLAIPDLESPVGLAFDPAGKRFACVTIGGSVALGRLGDAKTTWRVPGPHAGRTMIWQNTPGDVVIDEKNRQVVAISRFDGIVACDVETGQVRTRIAMNAFSGFALALGDDGRKLAVAPNGFRVEIVDAASLHLSSSSGSVAFAERSPYLSPNGETLAIVGSRSITLLPVHDKKEPIEVRTLTEIYRAGWSADGLNLGIIRNDKKRRRFGTIDVISAKNGSVIRSLATGAPVCDSVTFSRDGRAVIASDRKGIAIWDIASGNLIRRIVPQFSADGTENARWTEHVVVSPDGHTAAVEIRVRDEIRRSPVNESSISLIELCDLQSGDVLAPLYCPGRVNQFAFSPDGKILAAAASEHVTTVGVPPFPKLLIFDAEQVLRRRAAGWTETARRIPGKGRNGGSSLAFDPTGPRVLIYDGDRISLWDYQRMELRREWKFPEAIRRLAFMPDGKQFAVSNLDDSCYLVAVKGLRPEASEQSRVPH